MAHEKVYAVCEDQCLEETLTKEQIESELEDKSDSDHNHDERYYTESEVNALLEQKELPIGSVIILTSQKSNGGMNYGTWNYLGDKTIEISSYGVTSMIHGYFYNRAS